MRWLRELWSRLTYSARSMSAEHRVDDELAFHLERLTDKLRAQGLSDREARRRAAIAFGGRESAREQAREQLRATGLETFWRELRFSGRRFRQEARAHTFLIVATLAVGLGLATAMFAVADAVLWNRAPFPDSERLVIVGTEHRASKAASRPFVSLSAEPAQLEAWRAQADLFDRVEGYQSIVAIYQAASSAHLVRGASVTPDMLSLLGFTPQAGRSFHGDEGTSGLDRVVIISHHFWEQHFLRADGTVGQRVQLDGIPHEIVGIAPASFSFPDRATHLWIPGVPSAAPSAGTAERRSPVSMWIPVARLAPVDGLTPAHADSLARARGDAVNASVGLPAAGAVIVPLAGDAAERTRRTVILLLTGVASLLAVICLNATALSVSTSLARQTASAMKTALGASRGALVREAVFDHALVVGAGSLTGLAVSFGVLRAAGALLPDLVASGLNPPGLDGRALLFAAGISCAAGIVVAMPSVLIAARPIAAAIGGAGGRRASASKRTQRLRTALIACEVGLSLVLLIGTMLMGRTLLALYSIDRGLDPSGLVAIRVALPAVGFASVPTRERFVSDAVNVLRGMPGVQAASSGDLPPGSSMKLVLGTMTGAGGGEASLMHPLYEVQPNFFDTAGLSFVAGTTFAADTSPGSIIVSEAFAVQHWGDARSTVGRSFQIDGHARRVVGVVRDVRSLAMNSPERPVQIYHRAGSDYEGGIAIGVTAASTLADERTLLVRLTDQAPSVRALADAVQQLDRTVVIRTVESVDDLARADVAPSRFILGLVSTAGAVAMLISAIGIYGLLTHTVALRRQEIGIRLALGAAPRAIGRAVVARGLVVTGVGLGIGLAIAVPAVQLVRAELFGVEPFDPIAIGIAAGLLVLCAVGASWRPTLRATRVDPIELLRSE